MGLERSSPNRGSLSSGRSRAAARVLRSSQMAAAAAEPGGTFVVVEVGARYAPWAMRAVKAAEVLGRSSKFHVVALEPDTRHVGWIHEHFKMNGMGPTSDRHTLDVVQGFISRSMHQSFCVLMRSSVPLLFHGRLSAFLSWLAHQQLRCPAPRCASARVRCSPCPLSPRFELSVRVSYM